MRLLPAVLCRLIVAGVSAASLLMRALMVHLLALSRQEAMYMIGLAFFLIGAAIAAGFIVLGWKMACKAQEQDEKKNPK